MSPQLSHSHVDADLEFFERQIEEAKQEIQRWQEANTALSLQAAQRRAENQGAGHGIGGMLFGPKYRAAARRVAAADNARIAKEVAGKRATITAGKQAAQARLRSLKAQLAALKADLRARKAQEKQAAGDGRAKRLKAASTIDLLAKLKEAHSLGLLTDEEFEQKRQKLAADI